MSNDRHSAAAARGDGEGGLNLAAGVLAFALPGAGHAFLGDVRRGLLIGGGVLGLFFGGILIGGIDSVDSREDRLWFMGQALVGPAAFATDYVHQHWVKGVDLSSGRARSAMPNEVRDGSSGQLLPQEAGAGRPPSSKSLAKVNEIGTLYATVAGMLNLIAVLDALFPTRRVGVRA